VAAQLRVLDGERVQLLGHLRVGLEERLGADQELQTAELLAQLRREGFTFKKCFFDKEGDLLSEEPKAHPLVSQHRAWKQRVDALMKDFMLAPLGKSLFEEKPPKDPFDDFDDGAGTTH
jgi:hypothetical protein